MQVAVDASVPAVVGVVAADGLAVDASPRDLEPRLHALLEERQGPLTPQLDRRRRDVRDLLRHGRYKPTGRGKPASEYLLRAAAAGTFPRINGPVDICNFVSLSTLLPVSLWDLDRAESHRFLVRRGRQGEGFVFNAGGQTIDVEDLLVGCRIVAPDPAGIPIVNPVKDSLATKTTSETHRVGALIYAPVEYAAEVAEAVRVFSRLLGGCGPAAAARHAVVPAGAEETV